MKTLKLLLLLLLATTVTLTAQPPQAMKYKAIAKDEWGVPLPNKNISIRFTIYQGSEYGTCVYIETHQTTTNKFGLMDVNIGQGTASLGIFSDIDWGADDYYIQIELDPKGGTDFSLETESQQLLSVPYAFYAGGVLNSDDNDADPTNEIQDLLNVLSQGTDAGSNNITNLADPINDQDAATKAYVDSLIEQLYAQGALRVRDYDGNYYNTIKIGNQIWMAENLKTTKYNDGTAIPLVTYNLVWSILTTPGYCWYNNDEATYKNTYGALYNWYTVNAGNLCPTGWHVPTDDEWTTLTNYLGGEGVAGGKLKETGTIHWIHPNTGATNETGFTALPGGHRYSNGAFYFVGSNGFWWSSTEVSISDAYLRNLRYDYSHVGRYNVTKKSGCSVRCLRD